MKLNPEVRKYLDLIKQYNEISMGMDAIYENLTEEELVLIALGRINITPNNVYVYINAYKIIVEDNETKKIIVDKDDNIADYYLHKNLETKCNEWLEVPFSQKEDFEKNNQVIYPETDKNNEQFYYSLQEEYFKTLILESKELADKKIKQLVYKPKNNT